MSKKVIINTHHKYWDLGNIFERSREGKKDLLYGLKVKQLNKQADFANIDSAIAKRKLSR